MSEKENQVFFWDFSEFSRVLLPGMKRKAGHNQEFVIHPTDLKFWKVIEWSKDKE